MKCVQSLVGANVGETEGSWLDGDAVGVVVGLAEVGDRDGLTVGCSDDG
jgi:hypothetical protein